VSRRAATKTVVVRDEADHLAGWLRLRARFCGDREAGDLLERWEHAAEEQGRDAAAKTFVPLARAHVSKLVRCNE
jgi:hypothetical protein